VSAALLPSSSSPSLPLAHSTVDVPPKAIVKWSKEKVTKWAEETGIGIGCLIMCCCLSYAWCKVMEFAFYSDSPILVSIYGNWDLWKDVSEWKFCFRFSSTFTEIVFSLELTEGNFAMLKYNQQRKYHWFCLNSRCNRIFCLNHCCFQRAFFSHVKNKS